MNDEIQGGETAYYRTVIRQYDKAADKWLRRAKKIVKRYVDERPDGFVNLKRYNILWSNVETLKPAIYAQTPKPEVQRRFLDKDPVGRRASEVMERCIAYFVNQNPFGSTMRQSRDDYLLVGRGISWVRYVPHFRPMENTVPAGDQITDDRPQEVAYEDVAADYIHWQDFGHDIARTWEEVSIVWRIVYMTRDQMRARRFPDWNQIPLDYVPKDMKELADESGKKATVYEIWDKNTKKAFWIAKSWPKFLDVADDPLQLEHFFPCSRPIYGTLSNDSLIPTPDFVEYQDQAAELDDITNRIALLTKAVKAAGVYDASNKELGRLLSEGVNNQLIPVDSWAALMEKGGLKNALALLPMQEIAQTLLNLYEAREKVKQDLYEITGMSDIIRGASNPNTTATAEKIKSNFVTLRLSEKQREMQRFARNTIEIMGNVIAIHFSLETIQRVSGVKLLTAQQKAQLQQAPSMPNTSAGQYPPAPSGTAQPTTPPAIPEELQELLSEPTWEEVYALLKDSPERCFRIDIETDSTIAADQQQEQEQAVQFLTSLGGFIQQAEQAAQNPDLVPLLGQMLAFGVRRFPIGRELEGVIDDTIEKMTKKAAQPQPPKPDPDMAKVQMTGQLGQMKLQQDAALENQRMQNDMRIEQMKGQIAQQAEEAKASREAQMQLMAMHLDAQKEAQQQHFEQQMEAMKAGMQAQFDRWKAELDAKTKVEVAEIAAGATVDAAQISGAKEATQ